MDNQEIYCHICGGWFQFMGSVVIPPDVQAHQSECGHNLPLGNEMRDMNEHEVFEEPVQEPTPEPVKEPTKNSRKRFNPLNRDWE